MSTTAALWLMVSLALAADPDGASTTEEDQASETTPQPTPPAGEDTQEDGEAPAAEGTPAEGAPVDGEPPPTTDAAPTIDLSGAEQAPELTKTQLRWFKPDRGALGPNPYAQTDFTAYALEWGEVRVGLAAITAGVLPRVQLGTSIPLNLLSIYNGNAKANVLRLGRVDVGALANHFDLRSGDFHGTFTGIGANASGILTRMWSVHTSLLLHRIRASGVPNLDKLSPLLVDQGNAFLQSQFEQRGILDVAATSLTAEVATDVRFNRRDSIVLRAQSMVWRSVRAEVGINTDDLPPILGMDRWLDIDESGKSPIADAYVASAAYHLAWRRVDIRVGAGVSSVPAAWLLQSIDLSLRFGGPTRRSEARMLKTWKNNAEETGGGT